MVKTEYPVLIGKKLAYELNEELVVAQSNYIEYLKKDNARLQRLSTVQETLIVELEQQRLRMYEELAKFQLVIQAPPIPMFLDVQTAAAMAIAGRLR